MKRKILIVNTGGLGVGGITTHMINYLEKLVESNFFDIDIIATMLADKNIVSIFGSLNCRIIYLPHRKNKIFSYCCELSKLMKKNSYDAIHVHGSSSTISIELLIAKLNGIPQRIGHSHNTTCTYKLANKVLNPLLRNICTQAVACSKAAGDWLFGRGCFLILHNAFNYEPFLFNIQIRERKRYELGIPESITAIGVIGNMVEQKNQSYAIKIIKAMHVDNVELYIIGDGPLKDSLITDCKEYDIVHKVKFLGLRNDVNEILQALDIFLMTSKWEGLPVALLEAQASGVSCIVSDCITHEAGVVDTTVFLPLNSLEMWIESITDIDKSCVSRTLRSDKALYALTKDYNIEKEVEKLKQLYNFQCK